MEKLEALEREVEQLKAKLAASKKNASEWSEKWRIAYSHLLAARAERDTERVRAEKAETRLKQAQAELATDEARANLDAT